MDQHPRASTGSPVIRFLTLGAATLVTASLVYALTPEAKDLTSLWAFLFHLVPFVLAVETVAALRPEWIQRGRLREITMLAVFLGFMIFLVPHLFGEFSTGDGDRFYRWMMITAPYVIIALTAALRLGGAAAASARRFGYAALILMVSGLEDLFYLLVNSEPIPERWTWAEHMIVRLGGHVPSNEEAYVFIAVHIALAVVVLTLPWRRTRGNQAGPVGDDEPSSAVLSPVG
ncbi:MAG: hypothetical protein M3455_07335 [Actinomycetota bacterium]|nr:hypothetical protein [Actinomycetota bacterium]